MKRKCPHCYLPPLPTQKKKEKKEKGILSWSQTSAYTTWINASLLVRFHGIPMPQKCTGFALLMLFLLNLLMSSSLKWVYKWEHLCYLWNTLAKNNPACRIRLFLHLPAQHRHTCNLASGLEPAAMGSPIRQWGQSSDLAGCSLTDTAQHKHDRGLRGKCSQQEKQSGKGRLDRVWNALTGAGEEEKGSIVLICVKTRSGTPLRRCCLQGLPYRSKVYSTFWQAFLYILPPHHGSLSYATKTQRELKLRDSINPPIFYFSLQYRHSHELKKPKDFVWMFKPYFPTAGSVKNPLSMSKNIKFAYLLPMPTVRVQDNTIMKGIYKPKDMQWETVSPFFL